MKILPTPQPMKTHLRVLTNSQQRTFRRCKREAYLAYSLGYRPVIKAEPLVFGDLMHKGLEAWWSAPTDEARLDAAIAAIEPHARDAYELMRAGVLLEGYDARWRDEMQHFEVLAVECVFSAPLVNPETGAPSRTYELGGRLDAVVRDRRDGRVYLVEHKTTSDDIGSGSDYWKRLVIDPQISTYFAGGKAMGFEVHACIYDVIGKPGLRPLQATPEENRKYTKDGRLYAAQRAQDETPEEFRVRLTEHVAENPERYYARERVVRLEAEEQDAAYDSWQTARDIRESEISGRWPRNPDACVHFHRTCDYFGACTGTAELTDAEKFRKIDPDNPHEELATSTVAA